MSIPPDGRSPVTRTHGADAGPAKATRAAVVAVLCCAVVVGVLGAGVRTGFAPQIRLDEAVSRVFYVGDHRSAEVNGLLHVVTAPGTAVVRLVLAVPLLAWLLSTRAWRTAAWVAVAFVLISPLTTLCKNFFGRLRPQFAEGGAQNASLSFPSGHSSGIATLVGVGLLLAWPSLSAAHRRIALIVGAAAVVLVGLTRMWLGPHYLTDVLAGWALGIGWTLLTALVFGALPGGRAALRPRS